VNQAVWARLSELHIELLVEAPAHYLFARETFVALVERTPEGFGSIGSTGVMTPQGLAYLVWRKERAFLKAKGGEAEADDRQVEAIRKFSEDLKLAIEGEHAASQKG
jgi:hypothetical protein